MAPKKPEGKPKKKRSGASSLVRPLPRSPAPSAKKPRAGSPKCVVLYLQSPREKHWGILLQLDGSGLWLRGIELDSFDAWAREQTSPEVGHMGLSTFFVPHLRVEKVVLDEPVGPVPSLAERFESITGRPLAGLLKAEAGSR